jgi:Clp amino terminal domain, pathogenicity island component
MFERFTDLARRSLVLAQEESRIRDHREIDVGHLLLGALEADRIPTLDDERVAALRRAAEESLTGQRRRRRGRSGWIPFTGAVQRALARTGQIAADKGRTPITVADVLLAVLEQPPLPALIEREGLDLSTVAGEIPTARDESMPDDSADGQDADEPIVVPRPVLGPRWRWALLRTAQLNAIGWSALGGAFLASAAVSEVALRSAGLRFEPDDVDWTHGHGPIVTAAEALLLALTRRRAALGALTGDGLPTLRVRLL